MNDLDKKLLKKMLRVFKSDMRMPFTLGAVLTAEQKERKTEIKRAIQLVKELSKPKNCPVCSDDSPSF